MTMRHALAATLLAAAAGQGVLDDGGFAPAPRTVFALLSVLALAAAITADRRRAWKATRAPVVLVLAVLGASGVVSSLWTVGLVGDALRWGLVTIAYGAVAVAAAVLAGRRRGITMIAAGICALAATSAIFGLVGAASFSEPFADYTRGTWRPGGTLGYSAALSLLAVSALPPALSGMCARSRPVCAAATACGVICAAVLALGESRAELAFAGMILLAALLWPMRTVHARRPHAAGAVGVLVVAGIGAHLVAGEHVTMHATPNTARLLGELALVCLAPGVAWWVGRDRCARLGQRRLPFRRTAVASGVALLLVGVGISAAGSARGGDFWHGRLRTWASRDRDGRAEAADRRRG